MSVSNTNNIALGAALPLAGAAVTVPSMLYIGGMAKASKDEFIALRTEAKNVAKNADKYTKFVRPAIRRALIPAPVLILGEAAKQVNQGIDAVAKTTIKSHLRGMGSIAKSLGPVGWGAIASATLGFSALGGFASAASMKP